MRTLRTFILLFLAAAAASAEGQSADLLQNDWPEVLDEARESGKYLYVAFLGDGWSVSCKRFSRNILESETFRTFASERLLYCPVLAKGEKGLSKKATARLQALVIHFDIKSYPTLLLIAPDGREILRHGYREDDAKAYVDLLKAILPPKQENQSSGSPETKES